MSRIALTAGVSELSEVLESRGAEVVTGDGDGVQSAISAITPGLRDGTVDVVLLVCSDEQAVGMVGVWARSMALFAPATRFVGLGDWEGVQARVEPGCSLARLLGELGLGTREGDGQVTVRADGSLVRPRAEPVSEVVSAPSGEPGESSAARSPGDGPEPGSSSGAWGSSRTSSPALWGGPEPGPGREASPSGTGPEAGPEPAALSGAVPWGGGQVRDWGNVLFVLSGRGGVGRSSMAINLAEQAARAGRNVVLVDANVGQGGLATNLRVVRDGAASALPTIADLVAGAGVQQAVAGPKAVRSAGGADISFASVLAPDPDQATPEASSPQCYRRVVDRLVPLADLVVVDTCVSWVRDPTGIAPDLVAPGLRAGASALVVSDASLEGVNGVRRLVGWATRLAPGRVTGLLNMVPASAVPDQASASKLFRPVPCLAVVPYDESVRLRAARGVPVHRLLGLAADKVLAHLGVA